MKISEKSRKVRVIIDKKFVQFNKTSLNKLKK